MADEVSPVAELLGQVIYQFTVLKPFLPTYGHLLVSAIFPIYIGAHASLSRPTSAAKPPKKKGKKGGRETDDEDEEEGQGSMPKMEGLQPSDALMFPLTAGLTLGGLYLVIKWLGDPAILNKILSFYFSQMGLFFAVAFLKDSTVVFRSFVFPKKYRQGGKIWKADQSKRVFTVDDGLETVEARKSPLPGVLGSIPLPNFLLATLWFYRDLAYQRVKIRTHVRGLFDAKGRLGLSDLLSAIVGLCAVGYFAFVTKPWWLTNFLGFSFCYGALQFMSPSTFWTGSLILGSLFFYDIYFVFFTPLMVTVATKLDIPIKLLFPRPPGPSEAPDTTSLAMLGLGDIVIPGMMLGLALRFDLYLYYKRKGLRKIQAEGKGEALIKPQYQTATGGWGERFWTGTVKPRGPELEPPYNDARAFPKTYFKASVIGYISGMVTTLLAMQYSKHAQPALLYLVPGVLISLWGTAFFRREISDMWEFSDAEEEEEEDEKEGKKEKTGNGKEQKDQNKEKNTKSVFLRLLSGDASALKLETPENKSDEKESREKRDSGASKEGTKAQGSDSTKKDGKKKKDKSHDLNLISFSISLPRKSKSESKSKANGSSSEHSGSEDQDKPIRVPTVTPEQDSEPPAKRLRRSPRTADASANATVSLVA
ncbi:aspartic endopeptidase [Aspergillus ruber CBS 135680]|uniref:Putative signal peptide peptidase n=1 Tax=Aspergillus ruber (strain CBS 135680) TaxID=1388766 RepID=A0A017S8P0_ASPRC|nr:putative signal peptide peptidase [Aspergillus ruber CBS 135680]EYE93161.1 putative signal peptide peptidase [Aspergillus ruber CBS 135680]